MDCVPPKGLNYQHLGLWPYLEAAFAVVIKLRYGGTELGWVPRPAISVLIRRRRLGHRGTGTQRECLVTREAE